MGGIIDEYDAFIVDMDGTLVRGSSLMPGSAEFLHAAHVRGKRVIVLTDNSTSSRQSIARCLAASGVPVDPEHVVTSSYVIALELSRIAAESDVFMVGEKALADELRGCGHNIVEKAPADTVVVGFNHGFCYRSLATALPILMSGAALLATDEAPVYAAPEGAMPGAGSIVGAFRGMGYAPRVVAGKPRGAAVDLALALTGAAKERVAVVGDSVTNDGGAARYLGVDFLLVLSGVSSRDDTAEGRIAPIHILPTLADILSEGVR
jgi:4-nitrophenyl phosphatase